MDHKAKSRLADDCYEISNTLCRHLLHRLNKDANFPTVSFYAKSFLLASLTKLNAERYATDIARLKASIAVEPRSTKYHYEFNRYALLHCYTPADVERLLSRRFTYGRAANWSILRAICRTRSNIFQKILALAELLRVRLLFQTPQCIEDKRHLYSSQYNFFSLSLIFELPFPHKLLFPKSWLGKAVANCIEQSSSAGMSNLIGRGSLQSFGYSSLIYLLSNCYDSDKALSQVASLLRTLRNEAELYGTLPLTLCKRDQFAEDINATSIDLLHPKHIGWYSYNNHYDYAAFTALMLIKAAERLRRPARSLAIPAPPEKRFREISPNIYSYKSGSLVVIAGSQPKKNNEAALFSPIVASNNTLPFPPLGGEQTYPSLNNDTDFGFPIIRRHGNEVVIATAKFSKIIRDNAVETLLLATGSISYKRRIIVRKSCIVISDLIINTDDAPFDIQALRTPVSSAMTATYTVRPCRSWKPTFRHDLVQKATYSTIGECVIPSINFSCSTKGWAFVRGVYKL